MARPGWVGRHVKHVLVFGHSQPKTADSQRDCYSQWMVPEFGRLLERFLADRHWSHRAFARLLGCSNGYLSGVIRGDRLPPLDQMGTWAETMGLSVDDADLLKQEAMLAHCPDAIAADYRSLLAERSCLSQGKAAEIPEISYTTAKGDAQRPPAKRSRR